MSKTGTTDRQTDRQPGEISADCFNDRITKKNLGAFYTPDLYAKKAAELVQMAVNRALEAGKQKYIILDRCAGTGNLERALFGLYDKNGSELIEHCIVSTYNYYEYRVLRELMYGKVLAIIPPAEQNIESLAQGYISNANALSKEYIENAIIRRYIDDPDYAVILFENPPYSDSSSVNKGNSAKDSYASSEMLKYLNTFLNTNASTVRDLSNLFIWTAFNFYLRQPTDSYIVFSPIKYWKTLGLINKNPISGFICNREYFHASPSAITCILWSNIDSTINNFNLPVFDINNNTVVDINKNVNLSRVYSTLEKFYDRRTFSDDTYSDIHCEYDGYESQKNKLDGQSVNNSNIMGYLRAAGSSIATMTVYLASQMFYNARGFYLRSDNYLEKLPLFVAKLIPLDNWYDKEIYATTADGSDTYTKDRDFLKSCLIYTCLSNQNKCLSFDGSDGRYYRNELCFDNTNGDTVALTDLKTFELNGDEKKLIDLWNNIFLEACNTDEYDSSLTYGVYQISQELNTSGKYGSKTIYDYPDLNGYLKSLQIKLKEYYKKYITPKMFEYQLIK